jgi:hypothetical protein
MIVTVTTVEDYIKWPSLFDTRVYTTMVVGQRTSQPTKHNATQLLAI